MNFFEIEIDKQVVLGEYIKQSKHNDEKIYCDESSNVLVLRRGKNWIGISSMCQPCSELRLAVLATFLGPRWRGLESGQKGRDNGLLHRS